MHLVVGKACRVTLIGQLREAEAVCAQPVRRLYHIYT